jgi:hypothetical protein
MSISFLQNTKVETILIKTMASSKEITAWEVGTHSPIPVQSKQHMLLQLMGDR